MTGGAKIFAEEVFVLGTAREPDRVFLMATREQVCDVAAALSLGRVSVALRNEYEVFFPVYGQRREPPFVKDVFKHMR